MAADLAHVDSGLKASKIHAGSPPDLEPLYPKWRTLNTSPLTLTSIRHLFLNLIPDVSWPGFLSEAECQKLVRIVQSHEIGSYPVTDIWPRVGTIGIAFNHVSDKSAYFAHIAEAQSLQNRFRDEAGVDVVERVCEGLRTVCRLPVRIAREQDTEYFTGLLRLVDRSAKLHADYGPYDAPQWEIGRISAQITWNVLLQDVKGGECIVHNRPWHGVADDEYKNPPPDYGYHRKIVDDCESKSMKYNVGALHFFNSRNIHEVKAIDAPERYSRYTVSSFMGLLPDDEGRGPAIILWS